MPYKSKGKKDCTQSDGSKGKYQTVKKNGTKRCYKSKKQYDAAMAWAHEADEAGYGEEINEDIMRILVDRVWARYMNVASCGYCQVSLH